MKEQEISVSLNLLFDYRETKETISETLQFLDNNKHLFSKVKANFMFAFDGVLHNIDLTENVNIIVDEYSKKIHAYPVLPKCFDMDTMAQLVDEIESGNYSLEVLNSLNDSNTIVKKRYFLK